MTFDMYLRYRVRMFHRTYGKEDKKGYEKTQYDLFDLLFSNADQRLCAKMGCKPNDENSKHVGKHISVTFL